MTTGNRLLVIATALLLATGCAEDATEVAAPRTSIPTPSATRAADATPTGTPAPSPQPAPTGTATAAPSPSSLPDPELEDGRHFGFIRSVDTAAMTLELDLAYFLTGEEANQAAAERGGEVPVPNDYFIVNDNPRLRTLALAPDVEILLIDWQNCCDPRDLVEGELQPFADSFETKRHPADSPYQGGTLPYWLTIEAGLVVSIEGQYLP